MNSQSRKADIVDGKGLPRPVVILGAGRSGTKFLRDLLVASGEVAAIPFDINYVWRYGNENSPDDALDPATLTPEIIGSIRATLARLAGIKRKREARVLLEKTVSNTLRVPFVDAVLPNAIYVHLIRDGRAVAESSSRVWNKGPGGMYLLRKLRYFPWRNFRYAVWYFRNMLRSGDQKRVWGVRYPGIQRDLETRSLLEVCARQWQACIGEAQAALAAMPVDRVLQVRYEDLISDDKTIRGVCSFCGIVDPAPVIDTFNSRVDRSNRDKWREKLTSEQIEVLSSGIGETLRALGYDS